MTHDPDRRWRYVEPTAADDFTPREVVMTEAEILAIYFPTWCDRMRAVGKADEISPEACLEDWIVVHWAGEVKS